MTGFLCLLVAWNCIEEILDLEAYLEDAFLPPILDPNIEWTEAEFYSLLKFSKIDIINFEKDILFFDFEQNLVLNLFPLDEQFLSFNFNFNRYHSW